MQIEIGSYKLSAYLKESASNKYVVFLHGGSPSLGKDRFKEWQDNLFERGIGSFSFDSPGIATSEGILSEQSLEKRIATTVEVIRWFLKTYPGSELYLYGLSMGGYVAPGLVHEMPGVFQKLILQAPAAYSKAAHSLNFNDNFTQELRRPNSWKDSYSFEWLREYEGSTMVIASEKDATIPLEIIETYKSIIDKKSGSIFFLLKNAPHAIWTDSESDKSFRDLAFKEIFNFIIKE